MDENNYEIITMEDETTSEEKSGSVGAVLLLAGAAAVGSAVTLGVTKIISKIKKKKLEKKLDAELDATFEQPVVEVEAEND